MIELEYRDRRRTLESVTFIAAVSRGLSPSQVPFVRDGGGVWRARFEPPPVDRLEYLLELRFRNRRTTTITDPANPVRAPGPFGDKSVLELPAYRSPAWLEADPPRGELSDLAVRSRPFRRDLPIRLWSAAGSRAGDELPLLVVHDGPEMDKYALLTLFLDWLVDSGRVRPFRAALLQPIERNDLYWGPKPSVRHIRLRTIPDPVARVSALLAKEIDGVIDRGAVLPGQMQQLKGQPGITVGANPIARTQLLVFNCARPPFDDAGAAPTPHLVLLDLRLPKVDGLDVLRAVKTAPDLRKIPVVVLTSSAAEPDVSGAYAAHVNSYLVKPLDSDRLERMLQDVGRYWLGWNRPPDPVPSG